MDGQTIINSLYRELNLTAMALLVILLINCIVLFKQKFSDLMSIMILTGIVMCAFEFVWGISNGKPELTAVSYIGAGGYTVFFIIYASFFSIYFLGRFDRRPVKKWIYVLFYFVPITTMFLLAVTTQWTGLLFSVDSNGYVQEGIMFRSLYYILLMAYLIPSLVLSFYYLTAGRRKDASKYKTAFGLVIFGMLVPIMYLMQMLILGDPESDYFSLSLAIAIALIFLTTYVSTHSILEKQAKVEAVETDLRIAAKIQQDALPSAAPEFSGFKDVELRATINTAKEVGGDFYDYFNIDDHRLCFLISDVSGKGTPAALFMMTVKTMIKDFATTHDSTDEIFTIVNRRLCEKNEEGMFATAWIGILDTRTMKLQFTNAGHNYPVYLEKGGKCTVIRQVHGFFLGGFEDMVYKHDEIQLHTGDRLLLYTDGVTEAHGPGKSMFGEERLLKDVEGSASLNGEEVIDSILKDIRLFACKEPQFDDITMLVLSIKERER